MASVIHTEGLEKRYGDRAALGGIDLDVEEGAVFGFLGPNGAGKTTAIRILLGLLRPTRGKALVFGRDSWTESPRIKAEVGYLPGDLRLWRGLDGRGAIRFLSRMHGRDLSPSGAELAAAFDLDLDLRVGRMSRGTRQKLGLILALAHRPRLVILDEPTVALDPVIQQVLKERLRQLAAEGRTIFFSSHVLSEVSDLCDHVAILREGRIVEHGSVDSLRRAAGREVVLRWRDAEDAGRAPVPAGLEPSGRRGRECRYRFTGDVGALLQWLASRPIDDVTIGPPDLEGLFQRHYER